MPNLEDTDLNARVRVAIVALIVAIAPLAAAEAAQQRPGKECNIKGNVNTKGERIYHVPGQRYYDKTRIEAGHGERWFCSEAEARAAGWRASKV